MELFLICLYKIVISITSGNIQYKVLRQYYIAKNYFPQTEQSDVM